MIIVVWDYERSASAPNNLIDSISSSIEENWFSCLEIEQVPLVWYSHFIVVKLLNLIECNQHVQRWATLRKKQSDSKVGTSSQRSEAQLAAAHRAITLALNTPMGDNLQASRQMGTGNSLHFLYRASVDG